MRYLDFILYVGADQGQGWPVYVSSPAGRGRGTLCLPNESTFELDPGAAQSVRHFEAPEDANGGEARSPDPRQLGEQLFCSLFTGRVRQLFDESRGVVSAQEGLALRILIRLDPEDPSAGRLAEVPWELLYQRETRQFLNLSRKTPVSRDLVVPRPAQPLVFRSPLNVLAVTANPEGSDPLQLERERENLHRALETAAGVQVDFLQVATATELRRALRDVPYQVLHFMGHGQFDRERGEGRVLFEDDSGGIDAIPADAFADELRDCDALRLVVLNACSTGQWSITGGNPFAGLSTALILTGLPAVLAMQRPISDEAAIAFSHELYRHLAAGDPVDAAVVEGRLAIQRVERVQGSDVEWATPVLFLRGGTSPSSSTEDREGGEPTPSPDPNGPSGRRTWVLVVVAIAVLLTGLSLARYVGPASEPVSPNPVAQETAEDHDPDHRPSLPDRPSSATTSFDHQEFQQPPYRQGAFSTYIQLPPSNESTVVSPTWGSRLERGLEDGLAPLLEPTSSPNASWLVVLILESPRISEGGGFTCRLQARWELRHEGTLRPSQPVLEATGNGLTREAACRATLDKLAAQASQGLKDTYFSS